MILINFDNLIKTLNERQKKIYQMLEINQEKSAIAYLGAVRVLKDNMNPDRFHQAANSIRHIGALITRSKKKRKPFKKSKQKHFSRKLKVILTEEMQFLHQDIIKNIEDLIDRWQTLQDDYFIPIAHYSKKNFSEFEENFEDFEDILIELLKTSKDRKKILKQLLKIENPTQEHIDLLKNAILFPSDAHYFFIKLTSPNWLELLKNNNFFRDPPKEFSKHFTISSWPQANYLISISHIKSKEVLEIFSDLDDYENFLTFRRLLQCILNMPIEIAKDSIKLIIKWARNYMSTLELSFLKKLFIKLINSSEFNEALKLLEIMFNFSYPKIKTENFLHYNKYYFLLTSNLDGINQTILNIKDGNFQCKFIQILCKCLSEAIRSEIIKYIKISEDINGVKTQVNPELLLLREHSEILRQSIETEHDSLESNTIVHILINNIRDFTLALYSLDSEAFKKCVKSFLKYKWKTFTRLFLFMLDKHYDLLKADLSIILAKKELFEGKQCWHEYFHLLKNHFSEFTEDEKEIIFNWIKEDPDFTIPESSFTNNTEYKEYITHFNRIWRKRRLNPILDYLPEEIERKFNDLLTEAKKLKDPDYLRKRTGVSIYNPPDFHLNSIKDMNVDDQINHLKNFKPDNNFFPFSGKEGLGRAYALLIKDNPSKYNTLIQNFKDIPIEYLSDIIDGFKEAMNEGKLINHGLLLRIFNEIVKYIESLEPTGQEGNVYRVQWVIAQFFKVMLVETPIETIIENLELIWSLNLHQMKTKTVDYEKYSDSQSYHITPFSHYFYTLKGLKLENLISLIEILHTNSKEGEEIPLLKQFYQIIDELLEPNLDEGELIRAIIGSRLNFFFSLNESWTQERLALIFIDDKNKRNLWDVAWDSYIINHRFSVERFSLLKPQYKKSIDRLKSTSPNISFDGKKGVINHVITAYLKEVENLDKDSLIEYLFIQSDTEIRKLTWQILSNFIEPIYKIEDNNQRENIFKRYYKLLNHRIVQLKEKSNIKYEDVLEELEPKGLIFSRIQRLEKDHLLLLNDILELTKGNSGIFTDEILGKIKESLEIDHSIVLEILNKLVSSKNQSIWLNERTSDMIFDIISTLKNKEISQQSELIIKRIVEAMWNRGFHKFSDFE